VLYAGVSGAVLGAVGGVVGLVLGLRAHPATAWAAVVEVGAPAGFLGALLGLLAGSLVSLLKPSAADVRARRDSE
jgi:hypothetical protein